MTSDWKFSFGDPVCTKPGLYPNKKKVRHGWVKHRLIEGGRRRYHVNVKGVIYAFNEEELEFESKPN